MKRSSEYPREMMNECRFSVDLMLICDGEDGTKTQTTEEVE
jgi:hypothetical protein